MRVIVVGASGTIGPAVVTALSARHDVVKVGNKQRALHGDLASRIQSATCIGPYAHSMRSWVLEAWPKLPASTS